MAEACWFGPEDVLLKEGSQEKGSSADDNDDLDDMVSLVVIVSTSD